MSIRVCYTKQNPNAKTFTLHLFSYMCACVYIYIFITQTKGKLKQVLRLQTTFKEIKFYLKMKKKNLKKWLVGNLMLDN